MTEKAPETGMVKTDTETVLKFAQYCYERLQPATGPIASEMLSSLTAERDELHDRCKMYATRIEELVGEYDALAAEVEKLRGALAKVRSMNPSVTALTSDGSRRSAPCDLHRIARAASESDQ